MGIPAATLLQSRADLDQIAQPLSDRILGISKDGVSQLLGASIPVFDGSYSGGKKKEVVISPWNFPALGSCLLPLVLSLPPNAYAKANIHFDYCQNALISGHWWFSQPLCSNGQ